MNNKGDSPCHSERSEESYLLKDEILSFTQDDRPGWV